MANFDLLKNGNTTILTSFRYELVFDYQPLEDVSMYATRVTPTLPIQKPLEVSSDDIAIEFVEPDDFRVGNALMNCLGKNIGSLKILFKKQDGTTARTFLYNNVELVDCRLNDLDSSSGGTTSRRHNLVATTVRDLTWFERILQSLGVKINVISNFEGKFST
jgi:hypothetical protein